MTEDDTFKKLSRASFEELQSYWIHNSLAPVDITLGYVKSKGWGFKEFCDEWNRRESIT